MDVLYTDFEKAFDKVSHRKLVIKLDAYGLGGKLLEWIRSFLRCMKQRVVTEVSTSDIKCQLQELLVGCLKFPT